MTLYLGVAYHPVGLFYAGNYPLLPNYVGEGGANLLLKSNNRIINDDAYLHFLENPEDTSLHGLVIDCESIKNQLKVYSFDLQKGYCVDKLKLIKASARGTIESLKFMNIFIPVITFTLGLLGVYFGYLLKNPLRLVSNRVFILIIMIVTISLYAYMSILQRRRIGAAVFIGELVDVCIEEIEKAQPGDSDKLGNKDKEGLSISHGTVQSAQGFTTRRFRIRRAKK